jgi:hypothetical protein
MKTWAHAHSITSTQLHPLGYPQASKVGAPDQKQQQPNQKRQPRGAGKAPAAPYVVALRPEDVQRMRAEAPILTPEEVRRGRGQCGRLEPWGMSGRRLTPQTRRVRVLLETAERGGSHGRHLFTASCANWCMQSPCTAARATISTSATTLRPLPPFPDPCQLAALRREAQQRREEGMAAAKARKERMIALEEEARAKVCCWLG